MKILAVAFAYNEIKYIADMIKYYRDQGCDIFILDNHSIDGTREWLIKNKVRTSICKTGGLFHLLQLQDGLIKAIREIKPDWIVYTGIDIIYSFDGTIRETIEKADKGGYNIIGVRHFNMHNTGEQFVIPNKDHFFYARKGNMLYMIAKYQEPFSFNADSIVIKGRKVLNVDGVLINYGNCKPKAEREHTFRRRSRAWDAGLDRNYGVHYLEGHEKGWIWNKNELIDIRKTEYYKYIKKVKL